MKIQDDRKKLIRFVNSVAVIASGGDITFNPVSMASKDDKIVGKMKTSSEHCLIDFEYTPKSIEGCSDEIDVITFDPKKLHDVLKSLNEDIVTVEFTDEKIEAKTKMKVGRIRLQETLEEQTIKSLPDLSKKMQMEFIIDPAEVKSLAPELNLTGTKVYRVIVGSRARVSIGDLVSGVVEMETTLTARIKSLVEDAVEVKNDYGLVFGNIMSVLEGDTSVSMAPEFPCRIVNENEWLKLTYMLSPSD